MRRKVGTFLAVLLWTNSIGALAGPHNAPSTKFAVIEVADGIYMLQGKGGNVGVSVGDDGMLIVDDEYDSMSEALETELKKIGGDNLRFVLNTHWHGDHTGGNIMFGRHAHIVAHTNVRKRLMSRQEIKLFKMVQEAQPKEALPVITFDDSLFIYFNGEEVKAVHYPKGHTDGDIMVFFTGSNVVHMGDHYFARMFPFVDLASGGNVVSLTRNVKTVMDSLPEDVVIIPGHGPLSDMTNLRAYYEMLEGTTAYVRKLRDENMSLEQIQAKGLEPKWEQWSKGFINATNWIQFIYQSLDPPRTHKSMGIKGAGPTITG